MLLARTCCCCSITFVLPLIQHALLPSCTACAPVVLRLVCRPACVLGPQVLHSSVGMWCITHYWEKLSRANKVWCFLWSAPAGRQQPASCGNNALCAQRCMPFGLQTCFCGTLAVDEVPTHSSASDIAAMHCNCAGMVLLGVTPHVAHARGARVRPACRMF